MPKLEHINISNFHMETIGVVVADKEWNSKEIEVYPIELIPEEGPDIATTDENVIAVETDKGKEKIKLKKTKTIRATWLPLGDYNRITAPDIRRGERVFLWRMSNSDNWYWTPTSVQHNIRRQEIVTFAFSDKEHIVKDEPLEDMYYITINTRDKFLKLHTTDKYGEYCTYDILLNTKDGYLELLDGKGNYIKLDSTKDELTTYLHNKRTLIAEKEIYAETTNENRKIKENLTIELDRLAIKNNTVELVDWLIRLVETIIAHQHVGNLGIPTWVTSEFVGKFKSLISELETMKQ